MGRVNWFGVILLLADGVVPLGLNLADVIGGDLRRSTFVNIVYFIVLAAFACRYYTTYRISVLAGAVVIPFFVWGVFNGNPLGHIIKDLALIGFVPLAAGIFYNVHSLSKLEPYIRACALIAAASLVTLYFFTGGEKFIARYFSVGLALFLPVRRSRHILLNALLVVFIVSPVNNTGSLVLLLPLAAAWHFARYFTLNFANVVLKPYVMFPIFLFGVYAAQAITPHVSALTKSVSADMRLAELTYMLDKDPGYIIIGDGLGASMEPSAAYGDLLESDQLTSYSGRVFHYAPSFILSKFGLIGGMLAALLLYYGFQSIYVYDKKYVGVFLAWVVLSTITIGQAIKFPLTGYFIAPAAFALWRRIVGMRYRGRPDTLAKH